MCVMMLAIVTTLEQERYKDIVNESYSSRAVTHI